jgi:tetratricopeptide (TPR) repeat protein
MEAFVFELPVWLTVENIFKILDSKVFSAISWTASAFVALLGFIAKMKYRDANLKKLLDAYIKKAQRAEGRERESVKEVMKRAINKARGLASKKGFNPADPFEDAARMFAQSQSNEAIRILLREASACEATIDYANHRVRLTRERAATAYLEIGMIKRHLGQGMEAAEAFTSMLRVNPQDHDALRLRGAQYRDLRMFKEAEGDFITLEQLLGGDRAAIAEIKRELGAVFLGSGDHSRADAVLGAAMELEEELFSQRGVALTYESVGTLRTAQGYWKKAKASYEQSRVIFGNLGDRESVARVDVLLARLKEARDRELVRRRNKQGRKTAPAPQLVLH